jgi:hypothetical protein
MVWVKAAIRRWNLRHAARLELWAAREHARLREMAQRARDEFAEPVEVRDAGDWLHALRYDLLRNAQSVVDPEVWRRAQEAYLSGGPVLVDDVGNYLGRLWP